MPKSLSVGVLIIGSLYWDNSSERNQWRKNRLNWSNQFKVYAPIRYGRKSESRGNTYTMVISPSCPLGQAIVVQCLSIVSSIRDLVNEAEALWAAERNSVITNGKTSSNWGCVTLLVNPNSIIAPNLLRFWEKRTADYYKLPCLPKEYPLVERGILRIPWPNLLDEGPTPLDLLLVTANASEVSGKPPSYPSAQKIAKAWKTADPKYMQYFVHNRQNGIFTFQDREIGDILGISVA